MGLFGKIGIQRASLLTDGAVYGIYVAQNYQVPNITKLIDTTLHKAKQVEETYRKPKKKGSDDDNYHYKKMEHL
ncbi:hypothetical protein AAHE18_05G124900 [Arachis hypogaea]